MSPKETAALPLLLSAVYHENGFRVAEAETTRPFPKRKARPPQRPILSTHTSVTYHLTLPDTN